MRKVFSDASWEEYRSWQAEDARVLARVNALIEECERTPFRGTGKPEPLRGMPGWWSRRITGEHRLVYRVSGKGTDQSIEIAQCRGHYGDK